MGLIDSILKGIKDGRHCSHKETAFIGFTTESTEKSRIQWCVKCGAWRTYKEKYLTGAIMLSISIWHSPEN